MCKISKIANVILAIVVIVFMTLFLMIVAEAKTHGMLSRDSQGNIYISGTGWVRIGSDTYYSHKTRSRMYAKNEVCRNTFRWRDGRLYYFGRDGKAIRRSTKHIKIKKGAVAYIITPGTGGKERYSTKARRYQIKKKDGWHDTGNQTNVWWMCDWQL